MTHPNPATTPRYGNPPTGTRQGKILTTEEGGGYVTTCDCRWLRWWPTRTDAATGRREHAKKCKAGKAEGAAA